MSGSAFPAQTEDPIAAAMARLDAAVAQREARLAAQPDPRLRQDVTADLDVDRRTGAPAGVRAAVGAAQSQQDRLATLRARYPDAAPFGDGNFVFTDPQTQRRTLYNPSGLDFGDIASITPEIGEFAGGLLGGGLAATTAPATGGLGFLAVPAGVGLGAAAGREIAVNSASLFNGTRDTRSMPTRIGDAAVTAGANAVAGPVAEAAMAAARPMIGAVSRGFGRQTGDAALADFAASGVPATAGTATGNPTVQVIERGLSATPGGAMPMMRAAEAQSESLGAAVGREASALAGGVQPGTRADAGAALRAGARGATDRFQARQSELYGRAYQAIGADTPAPTPALQALGTELAEELARAPASRARTLDPALRRLAEIGNDAGETGVRFDTLRAIRTDLGRELRAPPTAASAPVSSAMPYLERVYGALTQDMNALARSAGPDAARALTTADRYTRLNRNLNLPSVERILASETDEQAYRMAFPTTGRPDAEALNRITRNLQPQEREALAATVLDRMGIPTAGQGAGETFSPATFLTNWNRLTQNGPEARNVLFGRSQNLTENLDRLVRVAGRVRDVERGRNTSNTAAVALAGAAGMSALNDLAEGDAAGLAKTIGLTLIAPHAAARLLTNPAFVRWAASEAPRAVNGVLPESSMQALARIAVITPQIRQEADSLRAALRDAPPTIGQPR